MPTFSRHMPPTWNEVSTVRLVVGVLVLAGGLAALLWYEPAARIILPALVVFTVASAIVESARSRRELARLAGERAGEGICTFARAFDRRAVDPWIIRAVHDEVAPYYTAGRGVRAPVRATDPLEARIGDPEEIEEIVVAAAGRAGYSLEQPERNPLYHGLTTVGDLVHFLAHQPCVRKPL